MLLQKGRSHTVISDPNKLLSSLDNDQEYESRKGIASYFQRMFRGRRKQGAPDISS
jgi:hypothetical protein